MNSLKTISLLLVVNFLTISVIIPTCASLCTRRCNKVNCCHDETITVTCCDGYILQLQNQTTANCIECLSAGTSCYQTDKPCCPGLRCGSGPVVYPDPRPTDQCISDLIKG